MKPVECRREQDVLDAIAAGRWPARCEPELARHLAECRTCVDLAEVVGALSEAHDALWPHVRVPSAGTVWWRAQLRARREAERQASRPMVLAQGLGAAIACLTAIVLLPAAAPWLSGIAAAFPGLPLPSLPSFALPSIGLPSIELPRVELSALAELGIWHWLGLAAFVVWIVVAPLALYFAGSED